jgi:hypothetical protein
VERFGVAIAGEAQREVIVAIDDPGITGFAREQRELIEGDDAAIVLGGTANDVADLIGKAQARAIDQALAGAGRAGLCDLRGLPWTPSSSCSAICWSSFITASIALSFTVI